MSNIKIFENEQFGRIRSVIKGEEIWFIGKDVCEVLEYAKYRDVLAKIDSDERMSIKVDTLGGKQDMIAVNEFGLYTLVLGSRKQEAKQFKRWITHDVIPSIRKTGSYSVKSKRMTKAQSIRLDIAAKAERRRNAELWYKFGCMRSEQEQKEICAYYGTAELAGKPVLTLPEAKELTYSATEIGQMLGVSANKIGRLAQKHNIKTEEYGKWFYDNAAHTHKQVETFRYYEKAIAKFRELLEAA